MARQAAVLKSQGSFNSGNLSGCPSPRNKRTLSSFSAEVLLAAAAAVIAERTAADRTQCAVGGPAERKVGSGGFLASDSIARSIPGSVGNAGGSLAGISHVPNVVRGDAGSAPYVPGPDPNPLARRKRISLDLSIVIPPLSSAPSTVGSTPASCKVLDLVSVSN